MVAALLRRRGVATFALFVVITEVVGRAVTSSVDRRLHVTPLADTTASYYPALLLAAKIAGALLLAVLASRAIRARAAAEASERVLGGLGHGAGWRAPRLRPGLSPRIWLCSFAATSAVYLVHADIEGIAEGRWPLVAPLMHSYALPVFAVLSVLVALAWRFASWLHDVEEFARRALARVQSVLAGGRGVRVEHGPPTDDRAPRRRFGQSFESRPPPLPA